MSKQTVALVSGTWASGVFIADALCDTPDVRA
jgi:hypothetical protein